MAFSEKISLIIDVVAGGAKSQLSNLKSELDNTEGGFNKLKVAGGGAMDFVKNNAMLAAGAVAAGGAAIIKFGIDSVGAFQELAIEAGKFADATGLSVDAASRLMEVAGDLGISSGTMETALGKMNKAIGTSPEKFEALGVSIKYASDGTVDSKATFLDAIDVLNGIKDPAERAALASKLFGKGWQEMAELLHLSSDEVRTAMDQVSEGQAISEKELERARKFRDLLDGVKDKLQEVSLAFGGFIEEQVESGSQGWAEFSHRIDQLWDLTGQGAQLAVKGIGATRDALKGSNDEAKEGGYIWDGLWDQIKKGSPESIAMLDQVTSNVTRLRTETEEATDAAAEMEEAYVEMLTAIKGDNSVLDVADAFDKAGEAGVAAFEASSTGAADATGKFRDSQRAINDLKTKVIEYHQSVGDIPISVTTAITTLVDQGKLDAAKWAVNSLSAPQQAQLAVIADTLGADAAVRALVTRWNNDVISLQIVAKGGAGYGPAKGGARASGGAVVSGGVYAMGEQGPEAVEWDASGRGRVSPAAATARMGAAAEAPVNVVVNVSGSVMTERQLIDAIHEGLVAKQRRAGPLGWTA